MRQIEADQRNRELKIQATYLIDSSNPYEIPTREWIDALKADPDFGHELKSLDMTQSSQRTQGQVEIYVFELKAAWALPEEPMKKKTGKKR